jgi:flagellar biosynthetic protein FlhB
MAEQDLDRSHAATPYKLEKARTRGQVAKSPDVVSTVVFTCAMVFLTWQGWKTWQDQFRFDQALLTAAAHVEASPPVLWSLVERMLRASLALAAPFFMTLFVAALAANVLQSGPVLSLDPIKMDWSRINPAQGLKRLFSLRTLFYGGRALLKLGLLGVVVYFALKRLMSHFYRLVDLSPSGIVRTLLHDIASLGLEISAMLAFIALLDLVFMRREFAKQMRMSRRELKDEIKHREGDPRIRARLRELRREMLKRSLKLRKTREADVLITNPTHVAVALRYAHGQMESPQLIAKGSGLLAAAMRQIAGRHGIPIVQNRSLARKLFHDLPVDHHVPPELYAQVARIIVWVFAMRDASRPGAAASSTRDRHWRHPTTSPAGAAWNS